MTQKKELDIVGPVRVTIKGPQGSGKTQLAKSILEHLEQLGVETIFYTSETPRKKRLWRKPFSETASVMVVEKQGEVI